MNIQWLVFDIFLKFLGKFVSPCNNRNMFNLLNVLRRRMWTLECNVEDCVPPTGLNSAKLSRGKSG